MRRELAWLVLFALILAMAPATATAAGRINRSGYIAITIDPVLYESNLWETSHRISLDRYFKRKAADLGEALAEGLEKTAFRGRLRVLPGYRMEEQAEFRETGTPDTFLLTVDIRTSYGLTEGSSLAACASGLSCFLLSSTDMFTYEAKTRATLTAFYFKPNGQRLRLVQEQYTSEGSMSGDFYDAMDMAQELEWVTRLTDQALEDIRRQIMADIPAELVQRSWRKAEDALNTPAGGDVSAGRLPPRPDLDQTEIVEPEPETAGRRPQELVPETELDLQQLIRGISPSIFKVKTEAGIASGFVISRRGFGVTALDSVEDVKSLQVRFHKGEPLRARVIQREPALRLAIIAFEGSSPQSLPLGHSVTGPAVAAGYPLDFGLSVTPIEITGLVQRGARSYLTLDTEIGGGNAGGPIVDRRGRVIGIMTREQADTRDLQQAVSIESAFAFFGHLADVDGD